MYQVLNNCLQVYGSLACIFLAIILAIQDPVSNDKLHIFPVYHVKRLGDGLLLFLCWVIFLDLIERLGAEEVKHCKCEFFPSPNLQHHLD